MRTRFMTAAAVRDTGRIRRNNEDAHAVGDRFWVVADGLGGHVGGEVASQLAVGACWRFLESIGRRRPLGLQEALAAFRVANSAVEAGVDEDPRLHGMGTTMVVALLNPHGTLLVGNIGDSRAYLLVDGVLKRITTDDNLAQELVDQGELTPEQARTHPGQFVLTRALGLGQQKAPKARIRAVTEASGRLLLCTDGLNGELSDAVIAGLLGGGAPDEAAANLVAAALEHGGNDNVTVIVVDL